MERAGVTGLDLLRRQARAALADLARPAAYAGVARELTLAAVHVAAYPTALLPARRPGAEADLAHRARLAIDLVTARMPVVLVHGWFHNRTAFTALSRTLRRHGLGSIHGFGYHPLAEPVPRIAERLAGRVGQVLEETGADACQIVAHSLGGLVARSYVQDLGGHETVDTVVTLGTPHRGTYVSYLGPGRATADMRPGSRFLRGLEETARPSPVRWVAFWSDLDLLIAPAVSAKLVSPALQATNVRLRDMGHTSVLLSRAALDGVAQWLVDREQGRPVPGWIPEDETVTASGA